MSHDSQGKQEDLGSTPAEAPAPDRLRLLLAHAFQRVNTADTPHIADDESLLARWSGGLLDEAERADITRHLATCSDCRELIAMMVTGGALTIPPAPPEPVLRRRSFEIAAVSVVAIAATVLVAILVPGLRPGRHTRLGQSLALNTFGFELDGQSYGMTLKVPPDDVLRDWQTQVRRRPDDVSVRLQFGRFLLEYNRPEEAADQFEAALGMEPGNPDALVGKGVSLYEQEYNANGTDFEPALRLFRQASQGPDNFAAHLNAAICLDRLGRAQDAASHWHGAYKAAPDEDTRRAIREHLRGRPIDLS